MAAVAIYPRCRKRVSSGGRLDKNSVPFLYAIKGRKGLSGGASRSALQRPYRSIPKGGHEDAKSYCNNCDRR